MAGDPGCLLPFTCKVHGEAAHFMAERQALGSDFYSFYSVAAQWSLCLGWFPG